MEDKKLMLKMMLKLPMSLNDLKPEEVFSKIFEVLAIPDYTSKSETLHASVSDTDHAVFTLYYRNEDPQIKYTDLRIAVKSKFRNGYSPSFAEIKVIDGQLNLSAVKDNYSYLVKIYTNKE